MVNFKIPFTVAVLCLICFNVFAVTVTDVPNDNQTNSDYVQLNALIQSDFVKLNQRIDSLPTKEVMETDMKTQIELMNQIMNDYKSALIVNYIIVSICLIGLFWGIFLYLKSKGRI